LLCSVLSFREGIELKIHEAARRGDIQGVARELTAGVTVDVLEYDSGPSALSCVCALPDADSNMILFLITQGAVISPPVFHAAVRSGNFDTIRLLLRFGAEVNAREDEGRSGALCAAVYTHYSPEDSSLLPLLTFLLEQGADPDIVSSYGESVLSVASNNGRFDAVQILLDHGADPAPLEWTDILRTVALGTIEELGALLEQGASLEDRDRWERTPWLLSLQTGDLNKARLLLAAGADPKDVGRCGKPPLFYAIEMNRPALLAWLLAEGFDINATDDFGHTALHTAVERGYSACVAMLLKAGADPRKLDSIGQTPIQVAANLAVARLLIEAGEDLSDVDAEVRRELTGLTERDLRVTREQYLAGRERRFGRANPERVENPFWRAMVQAGCNAYTARARFDDRKPYEGAPQPVWCYERFGRTTTLLPDGRIIEIAGEHEDSYDPDFCIYNDVVFFDGKGGFEILSYPERLFPPTDFHTATLVGDSLYIIGNLGYFKRRKPGETPVYRLDCRTFQIEAVRTYGEKPGWISKHKALYYAAADLIHVYGGQILGRELTPNTRAYALDLNSRRWTLLP
jgi:ankyrin repeat protein